MTFEDEKANRVREILPKVKHNPSFWTPGTCLYLKLNHQKAFSEWGFYVVKFSRLSSFSLTHTLSISFFISRPLSFLSLAKRQTNYFTVLWHRKRTWHKVGNIQQLDEWKWGWIKSWKIKHSRLIESNKQEIRENVVKYLILGFLHTTSFRICNISLLALLYHILFYLSFSIGFMYEKLSRPFSFLLDMLYLNESRRDEWGRKKKSVVDS